MADSEPTYTSNQRTNMVDTVRISQPSALINLIELPQRSDRDNLSRTITHFNEQIQSLCDSSNRLHYIDLPIEPADLLDGLHLNRSGNYKLVTAIRRAIIPGFIPPPPRSQLPPRHSQNKPVDFQQPQYPDSIDWQQPLRINLYTVQESSTTTNHDTRAHTKTGKSVDHTAPTTTEHPAIP
jgi:hypothetical protein